MIKKSIQLLTKNIRLLTPNLLTIFSLVIGLSILFITQEKNWIVVVLLLLLPITLNKLNSLVIRLIKIFIAHNKLTRTLIDFFFFGFVSAIICYITIYKGMLKPILSVINMHCLFGLILIPR